MRKISIRRVRTVATLAAAALLLSAFPAFANENDSSASFDASAFEADNVADGTLLVTTGAANDAAFISAASLSDDAVTQIADRVHRVQVEAGTEAEVGADIAAQSGVAAVEPSHIGSPAAVPDDELYDLQWAHQRTDAEAGWDIATGSSDVEVTILDTGINSEHPDLADRVGVQLRAQDGEVTEGTDGDNDSTGNGHGTWVAGVAGAATDNGIGIAGVDWASTLNDIDAFEGDTQQPVIFEENLIAAIDWAADNGQDVLNASVEFVGFECTEGMQAAADQAAAAGVIFVASSGNAGPNSTAAPANCDGVVSAGATNSVDEVAPYSTTNEDVDLSAPGGDFSRITDPTSQEDTAAEAILTTHNENAEHVTPAWEGEEYDTLQGTSFAAPYVAGVASLLRSVDGDLSPDAAADILRDTAVHPEDEERTDDYGHGIVNVAAALEAVDDEDPPEDDPRRIHGPDLDNTEVITQAIAASQDRFGDGEAEWAVLTRDNEYADALAGSTLTAGVAPVLYTGEEGSLSDDTAAELERVLGDDGVVAVLGGPDAVPTEVDDDLAELGFESDRIFGPSRGETAEELAYFIADTEGYGDGVVLAKAFDWPDAITAGSIGVQYGYPVLLTGYGEDQVDELHPSAARALEALEPDELITVGGTSAIGEEAEREAADIGDVPEENITRLGGGSRLETAMEVGDFIVDELGEEQTLTAFGANVRNENGWAYLLSTSSNLLGTATAPDEDATGGFYVPFEGDDGSRYLDDDTEFVREWVQGLDEEGLIVGGRDVITDEAADAFFEDLDAGDENGDE